MLRGGVIVLVAAMSVFFLKRKLYKHHFLGLFFVVLGISLIGISALFDKRNSDSSN
jgi:drug/metabolite transporter (DMT)-like permease